MTQQPPKEMFEHLADPVGSSGSPPPALVRDRKRAALSLIGMAILLAGGWYGFRYVTEWRFIASTDDAYVKTDTAILSARIAGHVLSVPVVDNQKIKTGDILVQIDPVDYQLAVDAARRRIDTQTATIGRIDAQARAQDAVVAQTQAQLSASHADQIRAASEFERAEALVERKFATPQRLDLARADRDRTTAAVAGATAALEAAQANVGVLRAQKAEAERTRDELKTTLERAQRDLDFATVRAPFDGVVGNRAAQPGAFVTPGARLMALVPLDTAYVEANFKETQLGRIKPGQKASIVVDACAGRRIEGAVESLAPASGAQFSLLPPENATGNFTKIVQRVPVRIRLPADLTKECQVRPGLSVVVEIDTRTDSAAR